MLMSKFWVFRSLHLLLCRHCIYVIDSLFSLASRWCDVSDFSSFIGEEAYSTSFRSQIRLGSDHIPSRLFIY